MSLTLNSGDLLHVQGQNGTGKSTLLRILAGLLAPNEGQVNWPENAAAPLFIGHKAGIKLELSALENIAWQQQLDGVQADAWQLLDDIGLLGLEDVPAQQLSAGQQRRIALTRLWYSPAQVWLLDEPFTSLDKQGIAMLEARIQQHVENGGAAVLTSHQALSLTAHSLLLTDQEGAPYA